MVDRAGAIRLSIVVPSYNSPRQLAECLAALRADAPADAELIVVDDASTDETPDVAKAAGARVLRLTRNAGPGRRAQPRRRARRRHGAPLRRRRRSRGAGRGAAGGGRLRGRSRPRRLLRLLRRPSPRARPRLALSEPPPPLRPPGRQRRGGDLLGRAAAPSAGPIFLGVGGFDALRFPRPSIEDIELGYRLRRAGHRILLDKGLQGTHLKRWGLASMVRTDVTCRALPWARLILETANAPADLNLRGTQRASAALAVARAGRRRPGASLARARGCSLPPRSPASW